jgi:hypothetical protein
MKVKDGRARYSYFAVDSDGGKNLIHQTATRITPSLAEAFLRANRKRMPNHEIEMIQHEN